MGVILDQQFAKVPLDAEPTAEGHLSWNVALDLWMVAELLWLAVVVVSMASTDFGGRLPGTSHPPIAVGWIAAFALLSLYHRSIEAQVVRTDRLKQAFYDWTKASIITMVVGFMLAELKVTSRVWVFATFVAGIVTISMIGAVARYRIAERSRNGSLGERIAIYGCTEKTDALISLIENGSGPVAKVLLMSDRRNRGGKTSYNGMVVGHDLEDFVTQIKTRKIDTVIIDLPWSAGSRIDDVVQSLEQISVNISMAPATLDLENAKQSVTYVGGRPTLSLYRRRMTGGQALAKIVFDRTAAAIGLLIIGLPLLIVGLIIKLDSPGPMLFRQSAAG